jgi:hypothetical protein
VFLRSRRSVLWRRLRDTRGCHQDCDCQCKGDCVAHDATVRRAGRCLNALEVTRGETLVTSR